MSATYQIVVVNANTTTRQETILPAGTPYRSIWLDADLPTGLAEIRVRLDNGQPLRLRPDQILEVDDCVAPRGGIVIQWDAAVSGQIQVAIGGA